MPPTLHNHRCTHFHSPESVNIYSRPITVYIFWYQQIDTSFTVTESLFCFECIPCSLLPLSRSGANNASASLTESALYIFAHQKCDSLQHKRHFSNFQFPESVALYCTTQTLLWTRTYPVSSPPAVWQMSQQREPLLTDLSGLLRTYPVPSRVCPVYIELELDSELELWLEFGLIWCWSCIYCQSWIWTLTCAWNCSSWFWEVALES